MTDAIDNLVKLHYSRLGIKNLAKGVVDGVWNCLNGNVRCLLLDVAKRYWHEKYSHISVYVVRTMDLFGMMLNFQANHVLWGIKSVLARPYLPVGANFAVIHQ